MQLVGTERLMAMNRRIGRSIRNAVRAQTDYLTNTRPVLYISTSYEQLLNTYKEYRDMDRKQLMKK